MEKRNSHILIQHLHSGTVVSRKELWATHIFTSSTVGHLEEPDSFWSSWYLAITNNYVKTGGDTCAKILRQKLRKQQQQRQCVTSNVMKEKIKSSHGWKSAWAANYWLWVMTYWLSIIQSPCFAIFLFGISHTHAHRRTKTDTENINRVKVKFPV